MIGLGSNRLSVCRRGGMSVTQAGRGGMEWLAGGRMPSWASPYSAAATAALKAQFPTQWPTIRDYGFAHPALVPFINEDPMLVMSLIEGLGTRWLVGDGASWCDYGKKVVNGHSYRCKAQVTESPLTTSSRNGYFGAWRAWNSNDCFAMRLFNADFSYYCGGTGANNNVSGIGNSTIELRAYTNGVFYIDGTRYTSDYSTISTSNALTLGIMAVKTETEPHAVFRGKYEFFEELDENSQVLSHLVGFVGQTMNGMLDIHDLEHPVFYPNAGTGTFTTSETPAS